ncbi:MAG: hypothetical protein ACOY16_12165 [Chloroflexota bacterium]
MINFDTHNRQPPMPLVSGFPLMRRLGWLDEMKAQRLEVKLEAEM